MAPASGPTRNGGRNDTAALMASHVVDPVSSKITNGTVTCCIQLPVLEITADVQNSAKSRCRNDSKAWERAPTALTHSDLTRIQGEYDTFRGSVRIGARLPQWP